MKHAENDTFHFKDQEDTFFWIIAIFVLTYSLFILALSSKFNIIYFLFFFFFYPVIIIKFVNWRLQSNETIIFGQQQIIGLYILTALFFVLSILPVTITFHLERFQVLIKFEYDYLNKLIDLSYVSVISLIPMMLQYLIINWYTDLTFMITSDGNKLLIESSNPLVVKKHAISFEGLVEINIFNEVDDNSFSNLAISRFVYENGKTSKFPIAFKNNRRTFNTIIQCLSMIKKVEIGNIKIDFGTMHNQWYLKFFNSHSIPDSITFDEIPSSNDVSIKSTIFGDGNQIMIGSWKHRFLGFIFSFIISLFSLYAVYNGVLLIIDSFDDFDSSTNLDVAFFLLNSIFLLSISLWMIYYGFIHLFGKFEIFNTENTIHLNFRFYGFSYTEITFPAWCTDIIQNKDQIKINSPILSIQVDHH